MRGSSVPATTTHSAIVSTANVSLRTRSVLVLASCTGITDSSKAILEYRERPSGHPMRGKMLITRRVEFSASHVCRKPGAGEEENRALYGVAANPHGHGHNYVLEVSLEG